MPTPKMRVEEAWHVLALPAEPSARAIKVAFRRLAKSTHPDAIGSGDAATARFARITEAYEIALADAVTAGRLASSGREALPARPTSAPRRTPPSPRPSPGAQRTTRAHPGSTTYDGAAEEDPVWDGAAWVGADSGTYWTVNPREYADPRKHGPEYRARGRRPVRREPRERPQAQPAASPQVRKPGEEGRSASFVIGAIVLFAVTLLANGPLRLAAGAALCALLAFAALGGRHR